MTADFLLPNREERTVLWSEMIGQAESYFEGVESLAVAPALNQSELYALLDGFSFDEPGSRLDVLHRFTEELKRHQVHTPILAISDCSIRLPHSWEFLVSRLRPL